MPLFVKVAKIMGFIVYPKAIRLVKNS